ncbi:unnamed protein product [Phytomonas sp. Hart1]|nr:unnamed protein product [Phytomonas sp. Hart1]|eukprot:CCW67229.1 unnamed protein product [Phytomonas sp. isolate Hart1]
MRPGLFLLVFLLISWVGSTAPPVEAAVQSFRLQRRLGVEGEWKDIANFTLKQFTPQSPVQLKHSQAGKPSVLLSEPEKQALAHVNLVYYRAFHQPAPSDPVPTRERDPVVVVVSPCTLIRGFFAQDSSTVVLYERIFVVPGPNASLDGLQISSEANLYHAKLRNGDECDLHVVEKLFPMVRTQVELNLANTEMDIKVLYEDDNQSQPPTNAKKGKGKTVTKRVQNENNEWEEKEVVEEEQTFLQKYWIYIAVFVGISIMKNFMA